jgi:purine-binding chemotaxis protein CheW
MSLRSRFGLEEDKETSQSRIIIIKPELQAMVGVQVDMVKEVVTLDEDAIEKNNVGLSDNGQLFISAVGKYNGELISILNLQAIVADKEQL